MTKNDPNSKVLIVEDTERTAQGLAQMVDYFGAISDCP